MINLWIDFGKVRSKRVEDKMDSDYIRFNDECYEAIDNYFENNEDIECSSWGRISGIEIKKHPNSDGSVFYFSKDGGAVLLSRHHGFIDISFSPVDTSIRESIESDLFKLVSEIDNGGILA